MAPSSHRPPAPSSERGGGASEGRRPCRVGRPPRRRSPTPEASTTVVLCPTPRASPQPPSELAGRKTCRQTPAANKRGLPRGIPPVHRRRGKRRARGLGRLTLSRNRRRRGENKGQRSGRPNRGHSRPHEAWSWTNVGTASAMLCSVWLSDFVYNDRTCPRGLWTRCTMPISKDKHRRSWTRHCWRAPSLKRGRTINNETYRVHS